MLYCLKHCVMLIPVRLTSKITYRNKKVTSCSSHIFFWCLVQYHKLLKNIRGPIGSAAGDVGSAPKKQRRVVSLQEKTELLGMYHRLRCAAVVAHFEKNESSVRTIVKKKKKKRKICEAITIDQWAGMKTLHFLSCVENATFMRVEECCKKGICL